MSTFSGNIGGEEYGAGWGGLVPTKAERERDKLDAKVAKDQKKPTRLRPRDHGKLAAW